MRSSETRGTPLPSCASLVAGCASAPDFGAWALAGGGIAPTQTTRPVTTSSFPKWGHLSMCSPVPSGYLVVRDGFDWLTHRRVARCTNPSKPLLLTAVKHHEAAG